VRKFPQHITLPSVGILSMLTTQKLGPEILDWITTATVSTIRLQRSVAMETSILVRSAILVAPQPHAQQTAPPSYNPFVAMETSILAKRAMTAIPSLATVAR